MLRWIFGMSVLLLAGASRADTLLTYQRNSPEMTAAGSSGQVSGGHVTAHILIGPDRVREDDERSVKSLRKDTHAVYFTRGRGYCQFRFPVVLENELSRELYDNLLRYPRDAGPAVVETTKLGARRIGRWQTTGTRIEVKSGPNSWKKVSVWTTDELPQVPYSLYSELRLALAPLSRSRPILALEQELAKLPGVPVRIETDQEDPMIGKVHADEELVAVEERAATAEEYVPPKAAKRFNSELCF